HRSPAIYTLSLHDALPISVGEPELANLAVQGLSVNAAGSAAVQAFNFSARDAREVKMDLAIDGHACAAPSISIAAGASTTWDVRSEEHTSELQSRSDLVCR